MRIPSFFRGWNRLTVALVVMSLALASSSTVYAQDAGAQRPIRLFLDCQYECDMEFTRTEIPWVDHVRDRADADVHVLVTTRSTAANAREFTLTFIGLREFSTLADTIVTVSPESDSQDRRRRVVTEALKRGLVRYVARRPGSERLTITYAAPSGTSGAGAAPARDRWNLWVFRTRANSYLNGEESSRSINVNGSVSANRISPAWKANVSLDGNYGENNFTFQDGTKFNSYSHGYGIRELLVKSLGPHWSAGQRSSITASTYQNTDLAFRFAPAVEYNIFPYSESTRRQLRLQYAIGATHYRYEDTTIFDKIRETRGDHSVLASLDTRQPWGSVSIALEGRALLDDPKKNRLELNPEFDIRLFRGLSLNLFGYVSLLRDQLYLAKGGATDEEVLLRRRQLATSYQYFLGAGLSYTFGSIYNNVVNPRFGNSAGY
ncbi:MAG: hypothetical protein NUW01_14730 [Gemmatimonadaceae bacterium]|nr:hypothetical protein [Gemmatimonadaceae bacterium]